MDAVVRCDDEALRAALTERLRRDGHAVVGAAHDVELLVCAPALPAPGRFADAGAGDWYAETTAPLGAVHAAVCDAVRGMRRAGAGRIVLVGAQSWPGDAVAGAARAATCLALGALAKTLGRELAPAGILVNGVSLDPRAPSAAVAEVVAFLAAPGADAIVGQILDPGPVGT